MEYCSFVTDRTPHVLWDFDIRQRNIEYLDSLEGGFFWHYVEAHQPLLSGENRHFAALVIRSAYSHALEAFFALLGSFVQAPQCAVGWMLTYTNEELRSLVRKISDGQPVLARLTTRPVTWNTIAHAVHCTPTGDAQMDSEVPEGFAQAWECLARDFLDPARDREYNNFKHGLRVGQGGFNISIGIPTSPEIPVPQEDMIDVGGSEYGSTFFEQERLGDRVNFHLKKTWLNWNPENHIAGLSLLSTSMANILSALKAVNGVDRGKCPIRYPKNPSIFREPWSHHLGGVTFDSHLELRREHITPLTREDVLGSYQEY